MRYRWLLVPVFISVPFVVDAQSPSKPVDLIFGVDKVKHFFIAGFVETMSFSSLQAAGANRSSARSAAIGATVAVSIGREIHDRRKKGLFSVKDLLWDAFGAGAALMVINKVQR